MKIGKKDVMEYFLIKKEGTTRDAAEYIINKFKSEGNAEEISYKEVYKKVLYYIKILEEEGSIKRKEWFGAWVFEFQNRAII
jgi:hypothetical protein